MATALRNRLADKKEELLDYVRKYGRYKAMDKYGIKSTLSMSELLEEWTHDKWFGYTPEIKLENYKTAGDQLLDAITRKITLMEDRTRKLEDENRWLREQLNDKFQKQKAINDIEQMFNLCKVGEVVENA